MPRYIDLTGQKLGRWTVIGYAGNDPNDCATWDCRCECGTRRIVRGQSLRVGKSTSCGCWSRESRATHGETNSAEFKAWAAMRSRCRIPSAGNFARYGGRGITVCDRWRDSFENFLSDMGRKPTPAHSIDRIDGSLGYSPENCRWATPTEQSRNTRHNRWLTFNGETLTMAEWNARVGASSPNAVWQRLNNGWPIERALTEPVRKRGK